jgi:holliday junction DNA helicase RuvA
MIGRLVGAVVAEEPDGGLLIDVGGVGYDVMTPLGTLGRAGAVGGEGHIVLFTHTHVREDALELYGFASVTERRVFRMLLGVPNVGPKTALGVLSALPVPELALAVESRDLGRLNRISGIGKKTAERLVLELREKLPQVGALEVQPGAVPPAQGNADRLLGALTNMGYRPQEAQRAVTALGDRISQEPIATLLRDALAELAR